MKSHLLAKKRRREDLNLAVCWTVSVTVPLCWTSTNIIYICNTFCTCSVLSGCSFAQWRYVTWDAREADFCWGRRAKTSSCLPKSCQVMKTTLQQGWPGILCQQRRQIFSTGEVLFSFVMPAWQGRSIWFRDYESSTKSHLSQKLRVARLASVWKCCRPLCKGEPRGKGPNAAKKSFAEKVKTQHYQNGKFFGSKRNRPLYKDETRHV